MEDASFHIDRKEALIAGIFDGHGGKDVAEKARQLVKKWLFGAWLGAGKNPWIAFETVINKIHEEVIEAEELNDMGSTALICFIDKETNLLFTATVGDSEATVYRRSQGTIKALPVSLLGDWKDPEEALRASIALGNEKIAMNWPRATPPNLLRYPCPFWKEETPIYPFYQEKDGIITYGRSAFGSINLSRAIGDKRYLGSKEKPILLHNPKITACRLKQGDILLLACDGLRECNIGRKECMQEEEIIREIELHQQELTQQQVDEEEGLYQSTIVESLAQRLTNCAIERNGSEDNVTTIVITAL